MRRTRVVDDTTIIYAQIRMIRETLMIDIDVRLKEDQKTIPPGCS
jgi:hypothetical protein